MNLNAPKVITWWVAIALAVLGILGYILSVTGALAGNWVMPLSFWIEFLAAALLAAATKLTNL